MQKLTALFLIQEDSRVILIKKQGNNVWSIPQFLSETHDPAKEIAQTVDEQMSGFFNIHKRLQTYSNSAYFLDMYYMSIFNSHIIFQHKFVKIRYGSHPKRIKCEKILIHTNYVDRNGNSIIIDPIVRVYH
jgi:hypothetical protein